MVTATIRAREAWPTPLSPPEPDKLDRRRPPLACSVRRSFTPAASILPVGHRVSSGMSIGPSTHCVEPSLVPLANLRILLAVALTSHGSRMTQAKASRLVVRPTHASLYGGTRTLRLSSVT